MLLCVHRRMMRKSCTRTGRNKETRIPRKTYSSPKVGSFNDVHYFPIMPDPRLQVQSPTRGANA